MVVDVLEQHCFAVVSACISSPHPTRIYVSRQPILTLILSLLNCFVTSASLPTAPHSNIYGSPPSSLLQLRRNESTAYKR